MHVLIIEDDLDLGFAPQQALQLNGISSLWLRRLGAAPLPTELADFDCVLLDLTLPDGDGLDLLLRWRHAQVTVPVVIITTRAALADRLAGLDDGADDVLVKPFETGEMLSRVRAVLRRAARQASDMWTLGDLQIEPRSYRVRLRGQALALLPGEFHLLLKLAREPGAVVPKGVLAPRLAPLGEALDSGVVEVHMSDLRRKIDPDRIRTVRGIGYLIVA